MPDNAITYCGVEVESCVFPLRPDHLCYPDLADVYERVEKIIGDLAAEVDRQPNALLARRDAMQLARLNVVQELIDGCLK